jgi:hypothetical protein
MVFVEPQQVVHRLDARGAQQRSVALLGQGLGEAAPDVLQGLLDARAVGGRRKERRGVGTAFADEAMIGRKRTGPRDAEADQRVADVMAVDRGEVVAEQVLELDAHPRSHPRAGRHRMKQPDR